MTSPDTAGAPTLGGRTIRTGLYLATIGTGVWAIVWPSATFVDVLGPLPASLFGTVMALAGVSCLYGTLRGRWKEELWGAPFATFSAGGFAALLVYTIGDSTGRGTIAGLAIMATLLLADRWREVWVISRLARERGAAWKSDSLN